MYILKIRAHTQFKIWLSLRRTSPHLYHKHHLVSDTQAYNFYFFATNKRAYKKRGQNSESLNIKQVVNTAVIML